jgi:hypothetical protein
MGILAYPGILLVYLNYLKTRITGIIITVEIMEMRFLFALLMNQLTMNVMYLIVTQVTASNLGRNTMEVLVKP